MYVSNYLCIAFDFSVSEMHPLELFYEVLGTLEKHLPQLKILLMKRPENLKTIKNSENDFIGYFQRHFTAIKIAQDFLRSKISHQIGVSLEIFVLMNNWVMGIFQLNKIKGISLLKNSDWNLYPEQGSFPNKQI